MQVTQTREVKTNISTAVQFTFSEDSSKLFSMLSSALYTNKELAIVYEIGANSFDANPEVPFLVVAPTILEPQIKFRDYGPGLAEHDVYRLLTVYGASDKSNDNSKIGGYGIGSKSPAAVTDTWTVTSYHQGMMKEFMVYINEHGIPSLTKIRETESTETGLEVSIPVSPNRFDAWKSALKSAFKYYPVKPIIKNCDVDTTELKVLSSGTNWKLIQIDTTYSYNVSMTVVTTHRAYSVDTSKLTIEFKDDPILCSLLKTNLVLEFDIGELQLSLSREQIQYTKKSVSAIRQHLEIVKSELFKKITDHLSSATDAFDYRKKIYELPKMLAGIHTFNHNSYCDIILKVINGKYDIFNLNDDIKHLKLKIAGKDIKQVLESLSMKVYNGRSFQTVKTNSTCFKSWAISLSLDYKTDTYYLRLSIPMMDKIKIVLADCRGAAARIKHNYDKIGAKFVLSSKKNIFPTELKSYITKASKLAAAPRTSKTRSVSTVNKTSFVYGFKRYSLTRIDPPIGKVAYVTFYNAKDSGTINESYWAFKRELLIDLGWDVVGLKTNSTSIPAGYTHIDVAFSQEFDELHKEGFWKNQTIKAMFDNISYTYSNRPLNCVLHNMLEFRTAHPSVWNEVQQELDDYKTAMVSVSPKVPYSTYERMCNIQKVAPFSISYTEIIDNISTKLYNTYSMLKVITKESSYSNRDIIEDYITSIGK